MEHKANYPIFIYNQIVMNHSILKLDSTRHYLLVEHGVYNNIQILDNHDNFTGEWDVKATHTDKTWYDTNEKFVEEKMLKIGDVFLNGIVSKMLSYDDYIKKFPESVATYDEVSSNTDHKGYIRKINQTKMQGRGFDIWYVPEVKYSVNIKRSELAILVKADLN